MHKKLASFKGERRQDRNNTVSQVGAAVLGRVARSGLSYAALR